ncbi:hypothetical protein BC833DRAFT_625435 [Globomyces pollinis-pini]|nr:hypothetical protein BC833DRAFT_625435 [Globomyces pollinis-pini]
MDLITNYESESEPESEGNLLESTNSSAQKDQTKKRKIDSDSEPDHYGRIRLVPHIVGNWSTHIYIKITLPDELMEKMNLIHLNLKERFPSSQLIAQPLHISLSKPVYLKVFQIKPFIDDLKIILNCIHSFWIGYCELNLYHNDEKTTSFLAIDINTGIAQKPKFHFSFLWDTYQHMKGLNLEKLKSNTMLQQEEYFVDEIQCQIGNHSYTFDLKTL